MYNKGILKPIFSRPFGWFRADLSIQNTHTAEESFLTVISSFCILLIRVSLVTQRIYESQMKRHDPPIANGTKKRNEEGDAQQDGGKGGRVDVQVVRVRVWTPPSMSTWQDVSPCSWLRHAKFALCSQASIFHRVYIRKITKNQVFCVDMQDQNFSLGH